MQHLFRFILFKDMDMNEHLFRFIFRTLTIASLEYKGLYISLDSLHYLTINENGYSQDA